MTQARSWCCDWCREAPRWPGDLQVLERGPRLCSRCRGRGRPPTELRDRATILWRRDPSLRALADELDLDPLAAFDLLKRLELVPTDERVRLEREALEAARGGASRAWK